MENPSKTSDQALATRANIMQVAFLEFSRHGLAGARIDRIADQTRTSKRMIYYHFESKEGLYREVLLAAYRHIRETEINLNLSRYEPVAGMQMLIRTTLQHYESNIRFVRLVLLENSYEIGAIHLMSDEVREMNRSALHVLDDLLVRGRESGVFRAGPTALDIHQLITSLAFFRVSDRFSWKELYGTDMLGEADSPHTRAIIEDAVMRHILVDPDGITWPLGNPCELPE